MVGSCLLGSGPTAEPTAELRAVLSGGTSLLGAVAAAATLVAKAAGRAVAARGAGVALQGAGGLLEGGRHDLGGEVQVLAQELNAGVGEEPVVVAPRVALGHELLALQALHELDHLEVGHALDLGVSGQVVVLLGEEDTLCEKRKEGGK